MIDLRLGDQIRFTQVPPAFSEPGYVLPPETRDLYLLLIRTGDLLTIDDFTADGEPIASYVDDGDPDNPVFHGLIITDDDNGCWQRVN